MATAHLNPNGFVLWSGPSQLTGEPIAVIGTGYREPSANPKTGAMIQIFIIPAHVNPVQAARDGSDASVCGDCPHRTKINPVTGKQERSCYVQPFQAPRAVFEAYQRGVYATVRTHAGRAALHAGLSVRLGAWGDPAAVPFDVMAAIVSRAKRHTGYTHQWRTCDARFSSLIMASVDTEQQYPIAKSAGWRTFRIQTTAAPFAREIVCPAAEEAGKRTTCERCGLCNGATADDRRRDIVILAHGAGKALLMARKLALTVVQ